jgi:hypothetical protein
MCYRGTLGNSNQEIQRSQTMDESSKSKRTETREFWEEAIRLWADSGLSVREFCVREGLSEHAFYWHRREVQPVIAASEIPQESFDANNGVAIPGGRRRQRRKRAAVGDLPEVAAPFVELVAPASVGFCHCTLDLENAAGAKMRVELRNSAMPDLAAISQSFWNHCR